MSGAIASQPALEAEAQLQTQEYVAEAERVRELLELCGIDGLSGSARLSAELIAKVCSTLQLAEPRPEHALAVWAQLLLRECKATVLKAQLQQHYSSTQADIQRISSHLQQLQQCLESTRSTLTAKEERSAQETRVLADLQAKDKEYGHHIRKSLRKLHALNLTPEVHHSNLVAKRERMVQLQQRLEQLQEQLAGYHSLPPSLLGASLVLKQARQRLQERKQVLEENLAQLG